MSNLPSLTTDRWQYCGAHNLIGYDTAAQWNAFFYGTDTALSTGTRLQIWITSAPLQKTTSKKCIQGIMCALLGHGLL